MAIDYLRNERISRSEAAFANLIGIAILLVMTREVLGGMLRYVLDRSGLSPLWFLPDATLIAILAAAVAWTALQGRISRPMLWILPLIALQTIIGFVKFRDAAGVFAGVKLLCPLLALLVVPPRYLNAKPWVFLCGVLLFIGFIGMLLNSYQSFPWTGYTFEQFGVTRQASRRVWIMGNERHGGFGIAASSAAQILAMLCLLVVRRLRGNVLRLLVYGATLVAINITTARTEMVVLVIAMVTQMWPRRLLRFGPGRLALAIFMAFCIFVPFLWAGLFLLNGQTVQVNDVGDLMSMQDRLYNTWPGVLEMIGEHSALTAVFGHGFGSIGTAATITGVYISPYSAADTLFIYMLYQYGLASFPLAILMISYTLKMPLDEKFIAFALGASAITLSCQGPAMLILIGVAVALGYFRYESAADVADNRQRRMALADPADPVTGMPPASRRSG